VRRIEAKENPSMLEFTIPAVSCGHCVRAVTDAVRAVDPKAAVQVDVGTKRVAVSTQVPRDALAAALTQAGYSPAA
jgi:copper chaperone